LRKRLAHKRLGRQVNREPGVQPFVAPATKGCTGTPRFNGNLAVGIRLLGVLVWTVGAATSAVLGSSTGMVPLSIRDLTRQADWVAHVIVTAKTTRREPNGRLASQVDLDVLGLWKGRVPSTRLALAVTSGVLGEQEVRAEHEPEYAPGEEFVVFLKRNQRGQGVTVGLAQGRFSVWRDARTGTPFVCNPFHGRPARAASELTSGVNERALPLAELQRQVLAAQP
jgi:hypothetical protein